MSTQLANVGSTTPPFDPIDAEDQLWNAERLKGLGSSEGHHLFPVLNLQDKDEQGSRYGCPRLLSYEKLGVKPDFEHAPQTLRLFERGHLMEEYAAQRYTEETGNRVFRANKPYVSKKFPFMRCNIDRRVKIGEDGRRKVLECKSANEHVAVRMEQEGLPIGYAIQIQHAIVTGEFDAGDFAVIVVPDYVDAVIEQIEDGPLRTRILNLLAPTFEFFSFESKRDETLIGLIVEKASKFWSLIEHGKLADPLPDLNDDRCKSCRFRKTCRGSAFAQANEAIPQRDKKSGVQYAAIENPDFIEAVTVRLGIMKTIAEQEDYLKGIDNELKQRFPPEVGVVQIPGTGVKIRWNFQRGAQRWDSEALNADSKTIGHKIALADWILSSKPQLRDEFIAAEQEVPTLADKYKVQGAPTRPFVFSLKGA